MALTDREVVGTLAEMDLLELDRDGPWPRPSEPSEDQVVEVDWDAVDRADPVEDHPGYNSESVAPDPWSRVRETVLAGAQGGPRVPPPDVLDAWAWYVPIHYYGYDWGIYVRESAVLTVAESIASRIPEPRRSEPDVIRGVVRAGLAVLYLHEAFHHKVESFAIRMEVVERCKRYAPYHREVFQPLVASGSDDLWEEGLACADMIRRLREQVYSRSIPVDVRDETRDMLYAWIPTLAPGYRIGIDLIEESTYGTTRDGLSSQVQDARLRPMRRETEWRLASETYRGLFNCRRVAYVVVPCGVRPVIPWFDQPVPTLSVSTRQAIRALKAQGYSVADGGKGSHIKLKKPHAPMVIVPGNRESLSFRVLKAVRDALGLDTLEAVANQ